MAKKKSSKKPTNAEKDLRAQVKKLQAKLERAENKADRWKSKAATAESAATKAERKLKKAKKTEKRSAGVPDEPLTVATVVGSDTLDNADATSTAGGPDETWTVAALKDEARSQGITGFSRMSKADLVAALR